MRTHKKVILWGIIGASIVSMTGFAEGRTGSQAGRKAESKQTEQISPEKEGKRNIEERIRTEEARETETVSETEAEIPWISFAQAEIADGTYRLEAKLEGGTGKTQFDGPLEISVDNGEGTLRFALDSVYYDYVKADGVRYEPLSHEENSLFEVPLSGIDFTFSFIGDTTRMSEPHEVAYTVQLHADALELISEDPLF